MGNLFSDQDGFSRKEIWAVGGGKGGTGKTFFTANIGLCLARQGRRVLLVDADLGCANLHTALGIPAPALTLSDCLRGKAATLRDVLISTDIPNLSLISGAQDFLEIANPRYSDKVKLIRQIQYLEFEHIILDLGAGTSFNILDFFLISDQGILVVVPEPTSIENVYRFIKSAFYRRFKKAVRDPQIRKIITMAMDQKNELGIRTPHDLIRHVGIIDAEAGERLSKAMSSFTPKLIVNQLRTKDDIALGFSMRSSCSKYFGINIEYLGYVDYDDAVWQATKKKRPLYLEYPFATSSLCIEKITHNLLKQEQLNFDLLIRR